MGDDAYKERIDCMRIETRKGCSDIPRPQPTNKHHGSRSSTACLVLCGASGQQDTKK
jgi:hypothetical protein